MKMGSTLLQRDIPQGAVLGVTRGCISKLNRSELQGHRRIQPYPEWGYADEHR